MPSGTGSSDHHADRRGVAGGEGASCSPGFEGAPASLRVLMDGLIDYAGLFPPAKLEMGRAVSTFASSLGGAHASALSRFICPVSRLGEFAASAEGLLPRVEDDEPWRLSAIIDGDLDENLDAIFAFNAEHASPENGLVVADVIEMKATSPGAIDDALDLLPEEIYPYFEVPIASTGGADVRGYIAAIAGNEAAAKVRTGGVTVGLFPSAADVASFIATCAAAQVAFKATAGLHHPVRAEHALTYEPDAPRGVMHGFCNVFLGAAAAWAHGLRAAELEALLTITDPSSIGFTGEHARIGGRKVSVDELRAARAEFCRGYGSCSFDEPIADLAALGWLARR